MLNVAILVGRLTADPQLGYTESVKANCKFILAVDRPGKTDTDFVPVISWGKQAENCAQFLKKGSLAAVEGRLQINKYQAKDGTQKQYPEINAHDVRFLGGKTQPDQSDQPNGGGSDGELW